MLKRWVEQDVLAKDDSAGKRNTIYFKSSQGPIQEELEQFIISGPG